MRMRWRLLVGVASSSCRRAQKLKLNNKGKVSRIRRMPHDMVRHVGEGRSRRQGRPVDSYVSVPDQKDENARHEAS